MAVHFGPDRERLWHRCLPGLRFQRCEQVGPYRALSWGIHRLLAMIVYNWFLGIPGRPLPAYRRRRLPAGVHHPRRRGEEGATEASL
ncbi:MAG: hypothetical protein ACLT98_05195 [Eggerthellaceae bacterium]